mgnify:FL=1
MTTLQRLDRHLRTELVSQQLISVLLLLVIVLLVSWPLSSLHPNNTWFSLAASRRLLFGLLGAFWGLALVRAPGPKRVVTALALLVMAIVTAPIEMLGFASSYPAASLTLSLVLSAAVPVGVFGLALLVGLLCLRLRVRWFALLLLPALFGALLMMDSWLDRPLLNPFTVTVGGTLPVVIFWSVLATATLVLTWRKA